MSGGWSRYTRAAASGNSGCAEAIIAPFVLGGVIFLIVAVVQTPRQYWYVWLWFAVAVGLFFGLSWLVRRHLS